MVSDIKLDKGNKIRPINSKTAPKRDLYLIKVESPFGCLTLICTSHIESDLVRTLSDKSIVPKVSLVC